MSRVEEVPTGLVIAVSGTGGTSQEDELTPDGVLSGIDRGKGYRTYIGIAAAEALIDRLRTPEWSGLAHDYGHPGIADGFVLHVVWRLDGAKPREVWMRNVIHPPIAELVTDVWRHVPPPAERGLPEDLEPWPIELPAWYLVVVSGEQPGRRYRLRGQAVIGRGASSTIRVADSAVSRVHARIKVGERVLQVEDVSENGTLVNGVRVHGHAALRDGDQLTIGQTAFKVWRCT